jgi:hypothetical protein
MYTVAMKAHLLIYNAEICDTIEATIFLHEEVPKEESPEGNFPAKRGSL